MKEIVLSLYDSHIVHTIFRFFLFYISTFLMTKTVFKHPPPAFLYTEGKFIFYYIAYIFADDRSAM